MFVTCLWRKVSWFLTSIPGGFCKKNILRKTKCEKCAYFLWVWWITRDPSWRSHNFIFTFLSSESCFFSRSFLPSRSSAEFCKINQSVIEIKIRSMSRCMYMRKRRTRSMSMSKSRSRIRSKSMIRSKSRSRSRSGRKSGSKSKSRSRSRSRGRTCLLSFAVSSPSLGVGGTRDLGLAGADLGSGCRLGLLNLGLVSNIQNVVGGCE